VQRHLPALHGVGPRVQAMPATFNAGCDRRVINIATIGAPEPLNPRFNYNDQVNPRFYSTS
jgi:hypothetical protein